MSRAKKAKQKNPLPLFVPMVWTMLNSRAFTELSHAAGKALPFFIGKPHVKYGTPEFYQTDFPFSYTEGERYGFARGTFSKVIRDLVKKGFVDPISRGGLRGFGRTTSRFRNSRRWERYGCPDFQSIEWNQFMDKKPVNF